MPTTTNQRTPADACSLLDADHRKVKKMFKEYEELAGSKSKTSIARKRDLAQQICLELTVHAQIEEEIFYPALREALRETDLLDEAEVEHASAKDLIAQIQDGDAMDDKFDAKVTVLGEYIDHHVKEERNEIFVKARASRKLDLVAMRETLQARKEEPDGRDAGHGLTRRPPWSASNRPPPDSRWRAICFEDRGQCRSSREGFGQRRALFLQKCQLHYI